MLKRKIYIAAFIIGFLQLSVLGQTIPALHKEQNRFDTLITDVNDDKVIYKISIPPQDTFGICRVQVISAIPKIKIFAP